MNTKYFIYLLPLIALMGGSCVNKKTFVLNQVSTEYVNGSRKNVWKGAEAMKKIPLKSQRILVIDGTDTQQESPYKDPLRVYADSSISADSLIESIYYNKLVLKSLKDNLPLKAETWIFTEKLSEKALDSLVHAYKFDLVITAQQIKFDYKFRYRGLKEFNENIKKAPNNHNEDAVIATPAFTGKLSQDAVYANSLGPAFDFPSTGRQPPLVTRTITCCTCWNLRWITTPPDKRSETLSWQLKQESTIKYNFNYAEVIFSSAAIQVGKSLAQVFGK